MLRRLRPNGGLRHLRNALSGFVLCRSLRFRPHSATAPFAPNNGAKGLRLRAGCAVLNPNTAGCFATGSVASVGLGSLRCRLRGSSARLSFAQPAVSPHGAARSRPHVSPASFTVRCCLPSHVRWSAIQRNARNYAQRKKRAVRPAPAVLHYVFVPPLVFDPLPAQRVAARGAPAAARFPLPCSRPAPVRPSGAP